MALLFVRNRDMNKAIILAHGGAGLIPDSRVQPKLEGLKRAIKEGASSFLKEKNARHSVCTTVACMEDDPAFNAGFGSVLNEDGEVEMDAALMDGRNLELGGVTGVGKRLIYHISRLFSTLLRGRSQTKLTRQGR